MLSVPGAAQTEQLKHSLKTSGRLRMDCVHTCIATIQNTVENKIHEHCKLRSHRLISL